MIFQLTHALQIPMRESIVLCLATHMLICINSQCEEARLFAVFRYDESHIAFQICFAHQTKSKAMDQQNNTLFSQPKLSFEYIKPQCPKALCKISFLVKAICKLIPAIPRTNLCNSTLENIGLRRVTFIFIDKSCQLLVLIYLMAII